MVHNASISQEDHIVEERDELGGWLQSGADTVTSNTRAALYIVRTNLQKGGDHTHASLDDLVAERTEYLLRHRRVQA